MTVNRPNFLDTGIGNSHGASMKTHILAATGKNQWWTKKYIKLFSKKAQRNNFWALLLLGASLCIVFNLKVVSKVVIMIRLLEDETKAQEKLVAQKLKVNGKEKI